MKKTNPAYLAEPAYEVFRFDDGTVRTVLVHFQHRRVKVARTVFPHDEALADLGLDASGRPVMLVLQGPVEGRTLVGTVEGIVHAAGIGPEGDEGRGESVARVLRGLFRGLERFSSRPAPPSQPEPAALA